ncbi:MAG: plasmid pRiA4b ORF-3 family protein [Advenella sp.]
MKTTIQRSGTRNKAASKTTPLEGKAMVLRIELRETNPAVYRVILVPSRITLPKLHVTILRAMGWDGGHLHEFIINDTHYGEIDPEFPFPDMKSQSRVRLDKALGVTHSFDYIYDYGDVWWHNVEVIEFADFRGPLDSPWCLDGKRACPPEDVGGIPGYLDFIDVMADSKHPEHQQMMEWYGRPYNPEAFDLEEVNQRLMEIRL